MNNNLSNVDLPLVAKSSFLEAFKAEAYRDFLGKNSLFENSIKTMNDFQKLPIMDKNSYIRSYDLHQIFPNNEISPIGHVSSGSSGKPTLWFRGEKQEHLAAKIIYDIFKKIFKLELNNNSTLVVVTFAMGIWVAGTHVQLACNRILNTTNSKFTLFTPGADLNDILYILESVAPNFKNVVLFGYPPFISKILHESKIKKLKLKQSFFIIGAGGNFSEEWRDGILDFFCYNESCVNRIINMYACSDAGILAHETPLSIYIRRLARKNESLREKIFGAGLSNLPLLVQYHTDKIYFENIGSELILTLNADIPLVRYNIKDLGSVKTHFEVVNILKNCELGSSMRSDLINEWQIPFVTVNGRSDVAINFNCAKIPADFFIEAIQSDRIAKFLSGYFIAYTSETSDGELFNIDLEVADQIELRKTDKNDISQHIFLALKSLCKEYNDVCKNISDQEAFPRIKFCKFDNNNIEKNHKNFKSMIIAVPGKKPHVVI